MQHSFRKRMTDEREELPNTGRRPHYRWPWFVLGAVVLAVMLAILWMSKEIDRTRRLRDQTPPPAPAQTNPPASASPER